MSSNPDQPREERPSSAPDHDQVQEPAKPSQAEDSSNKPASGPQSQAHEQLALTTGRVLRFAFEAGLELFCDQRDIPFGNIPCRRSEQHWECWPVKSRRFRRCLTALVQDEARGRPSPSVLKDALDVMELLADEAKPRYLANRVAVTDDSSIRIDLGDKLWRTILVNQDRWSVVREKEPRFYRSRHQLPFVEPARGGRLSELFKFVRIRDRHERRLLLAWLISAFIPSIPTPILLHVGQQGSAKTTHCRRVRSLLDPSTVPTLGEIELRDLMQVFQHHAVPCFENVSYFSQRQADAFCRAVTGDGIERRKLYTDADSVIFSFRRAIMMNGIDIPSHRPDFLDRCVILHCKRIDRFRTLQSLDERFEQAKPRLLGAVLDLLVATLRLLGSTPQTREFRMADFAHLGRTVVRALGRKPEEFDAAYRGNIRQQGAELLEDCPVARSLVVFAAGYPDGAPFRGNAETLLKKLTAIAKEKKIPMSSKSWPGSPRWLSTRLSELTPILAANDVIVQRLPRENNCRPWLVYKRRPNGTK